MVQKLQVPLDWGLSRRSSAAAAACGGDGSEDGDEEGESGASEGPEWSHGVDHGE